jgi:hypothetical protein
MIKFQFAQTQLGTNVGVVVSRTSLRLTLPYPVQVDHKRSQTHRK